MKGLGEIADFRLERALDDAENADDADAQADELQSAFDGMLVAEELNWGCSGIATSILANGLGSGPVLLAGSDEQKETWLPPLLEAPILCSFGLSEPDAGSDVARMKTTAERRGDEYVRVAERLTHQLIDLKKYAAAVTCPTAFIRGTRSAEMTPEAAKDVAKFWTRTEVDIYSVEATTSLQLENPKDLAAAINAFAAKKL